MTITGGGISPDGRHWEPARNEYLLAVNQSHVTFRWKDRGTDTWRTTRLEGVEFLRRFLQHVLPRGFHKVRYYGLWHHSRRELANRAWLLLVLEQPTDLQRPMKIAELIEAIGRLTLFDEQEDISPETDGADNPCCPHCGSRQTTLLAEWPPPGSFR